MIELTFEDNGLSVNLANAKPILGRQLERWITDSCLHLVGAVQKNIGASGLIGRRTGTLARSITFTVTPGPEGPVGEVFPNPAQVAYGAIQETGGTITPKAARALTIPLAAMLTPNGVARGTAAQVRDNPHAFGFIATFIPKGKDVIVGITEKKGAIIPLFALKPSVTLPGTHYLSTTLTQELSWMADRLEAIADETVELIFGPAA